MAKFFKKSILHFVAKKSFSLASKNSFPFKFLEREKTFFALSDKLV